jgi:hypothetical protein
VAHHVDALDCIYTDPRDRQCDFYAQGGKAE